MDVSRAVWRKPTYSTSDGTCVEVAAAENDIAVRDSKDPAGPDLHFSAGGWRAFLARVKR